MLGFYAKLRGEILPLYYSKPDDWARIVFNSMNDVVPFFDSDRMAAEYYEKMYV
jgi:starch phosphorylase